jgi:spore maturation protein CgeD
MKITCILASYNRPTLIRQALQSVLDQTHQDYQLIVVDDSTKMNIFEIMGPYKFTESLTIHNIVKPEERSKVNRLGININIGLKNARGDVICYLADDDYYFPTWFEKLNRFFEENPDKQVAYGILKYSESMMMELEEQGTFRFPGDIVKEPMGILDHNQVAHRRFDPPQLWQEGVGTVMNVDGWFFSQIANEHDFHPINAWAAVKRLHGKNLQGSVSMYQGGKMDDLRE